MNYQGKFSHGASSGRRRKSRGFSGKLVLLVLALALLSGAVLGTLAYLISDTEPVTNTFTPGKVPNTPEETIDENYAKTSITIKNEGNIPAYIRIRLVTYRVNDKNEHIGGEATIPEFDLGTGWFKKGDFYYYESPVAAGDSPPNLLGSGETIPLKTYDDADGGKQVIEVISESIQSLPTTTVKDAWGVSVGADGNLEQESNAGGMQ